MSYHLLDLEGVYVAVAEDDESSCQATFDGWLCSLLPNHGPETGHVACCFVDVHGDMKDELGTPTEIVARWEGAGVPRREGAR